MKSLNVCREKWAHEPGSRFRSHPLRRGDLFGASSPTSASALMSLCAAGRRARWARSAARLASRVEDGGEMPGTTGERQRCKQNDYLNLNENWFVFFMCQGKQRKMLWNCMWCVLDLIKRFPPVCLQRDAEKPGEEKETQSSDFSAWTFCFLSLNIIRDI